MKISDCKFSSLRYAHLSTVNLNNCNVSKNALRNRDIKCEVLMEYLNKSYRFHKIAHFFPLSFLKTILYSTQHGRRQERTVKVAAPLDPSIYTFKQ